MAVPKEAIRRIFLDRVAVTINELVRKDSRKSIWQDGKKGGQYKSAQYKKYKARGMTKLDGKRLAGYKGVAIISRQTGKVDMTVTGRLANDLKKIKTGGDFIVMGYSDGSAGAVLGNQALGRDVVGLNKKNQKIIRQMYQDELIKFFKRI